MKEHEEKEYKVMLSEKQFQRLCDLLGNPRPVKQENRYYDTEDWKIRRQYGSMPQREDGKGACRACQQISVQDDEKEDHLDHHAQR